MITHLLVKPAHKNPMVPVNEMQVSKDGIAGQVESPPLRQVLLLEEKTLQDFNLQPGDLRENIIVRDLDLYNLKSGCVIKIGEALIGLTFLCEPCSIIADKVNLKDIRDQRGILGRFLNAGTIRIGDTVTITDQKIESIPFKPFDRIKWYLDKIDTPIRAIDLMWQAGLASSYCRALPAMLKKHPEIKASKIVFSSRN